MKFKLILFSLIISILLVNIANAQVKDYYWEDITTHLYINPDGTVFVEETQEFNFTGPFTFAYRYFHFDEIDEIKSIKVFENNIEITNKKVYNENSFRVVKWFFNAQNERRKFLLTYKVTGLIKSEKERDRIFWTAVFKDHSKDVKKASLYLHFPKPIDINQLNYRTSLTSNYELIDEKTIKISTNNIYAYNPFDVEFYFQKDMITEIPITSFLAKFLKYLIIP